MLALLLWAWARERHVRCACCVQTWRNGCRRGAAGSVGVASFTQLGVGLISFRSLLKRSPDPLLGLDISSSALKLVELRRAGGAALTLRHCASAPLESGWVNQGSIEKFDEVAEALRGLLRKTGSNTKDVAMALPAAAVITKKINFPANLNPEMLEIQVESEAAQYIPFPLSEVSLDFCVMGPAPNIPDYVTVALAAARKEKVMERQGLAEAAGLNLVVLDVESYAARLAATRVIETLPDRGRNMLIALFDLGTQSSSLQVIRDDDVIYEREQSFGAVQLNNLMARHYSWSSEEAENRRRTRSFPEDFAQAVLTPYLDGLGQDIGRALQFFFTSTQHNKIDQVLLSGAAAVWPGMDAVVTHHTKLPCKVIDTFAGMSLGRALQSDALQGEAPAYLVATGLALRRLGP